jgi:restriction system protein
MDLRMNPNSLFAILLRRPWWVSGGIAAAFVVLARLVLPPQWFIVGAAAAIPFIAIAAMAGWRQLGTPGEARVGATVARLRAMSWPELAGAVAEAWKRDGHEVVAIDEPGADFEVAKAGRRGLIAARRWKAARLGIEPLRELQATRERREVRDCWCLVTGEVSEPARRFAGQHRIVLVEGVELARRMSQRLQLRDWLRGR